MKKLLTFTVASMFVLGNANAVYRMGWERPIMVANLNPVESLLLYPQAQTLTINRRDGAKQPTSFTLVEDSGIRCIKAPCPSFRTTMFVIQKVSPSFHNADVVRYEAVEVLKNIPANVRIARRQLNVTESSMELVAAGGNGFQRRTIWDVEIVTFPSKLREYRGYPTTLATILGAN